MHVSLRACLAVCLLLAVASAAAAQDWAGRGRATGTVKDESGEPISGARVQAFKGSLDNGPEAITTDEKGRFLFGGLAGGTWTVNIDADGYKPSQGTFYVNEFGANAPAAIVLARDPGSSIDTGDALLDQGDYAGARAAYVQAMQGLDEVGQARLRSRVGDSYLKEGNLEAAKKEYQQALGYLQPTEQSHVRINLGNAYQAQADYAAARKEYEQAAVTLTGEGKATVLTQIARGYYAEENYEAAIAKLEQAVELSPGNAAAIQVLADILTRQGREEEAAKYLAQLPDDATLPTDMVLNIGIRLYNEGDTAKALEYFERAVAEAPDNPEGFYYRGLCKLGTGDNDGAKADFEKLLQMDPNSSHKAEVEEFLQFLNQ